MVNILIIFFAKVGKKKIKIIFCFLLALYFLSLWFTSFSYICKFNSLYYIKIVLRSIHCKFTYPIFSIGSNIKMYITLFWPSKGLWSSCKYKVNTQDIIQE